MQPIRLIAFLAAFVSALFVISPSLAANFQINAASGAEKGWSAKAECDANGGGCVSAYFCSNEIWLDASAFERVQSRRYDGQQLVIVKDGSPICAVN